MHACAYVYMHAHAYACAHIAHACTNLATRQNMEPVPVYQHQVAVEPSCYPLLDTAPGVGTPH